MEPCLFRHGKRKHRGELERIVRASMEPCLFRHGKEGAGRSREPDEPDWLQWSHVFSDMVRFMRLGMSEAEAASMEPCLFRHGKTTLAADHTSGGTSFNGAMSFQTW